MWHLIEQQKQEPLQTAKRQAPTAAAIQERQEQLKRRRLARQAHIKNQFGSEWIDTESFFIYKTVAELKEHGGSIEEFFVKQCETPEFAEMWSEIGYRPSFHPNTTLSSERQKMFLDAIQELPPDAKLGLVFHGTHTENIAPILKDGLDPAKRRRQSMGPGEYFATHPGVSTSYCRGACGDGLKMLAFVVVLPPALHHKLRERNVGSREKEEDGKQEEDKKPPATKEDSKPKATDQPPQSTMPSMQAAGSGPTDPATSGDDELIVDLVETTMKLHQQANGGASSSPPQIASAPGDRISRQLDNVASTYQQQESKQNQAPLSDIGNGTTRANTGPRDVVRLVDMLSIPQPGVGSTIAAAAPLPATTAPGGNTKPCQLDDASNTPQQQTLKQNLHAPLCSDTGNGTIHAALRRDDLDAVRILGKLKNPQQGTSSIIGAAAAVASPEAWNSIACGSLEGDAKPKDSEFNTNFQQAVLQACSEDLTAVNSNQAPPHTSSMDVQSVAAAKALGGGQMSHLCMAGGSQQGAMGPNNSDFNIGFLQGLRQGLTGDSQAVNSNQAPQRTCTNDVQCKGTASGSQQGNTKPNTAAFNTSFLQGMLQALSGDSQAVNSNKVHQHTSQCGAASPSGEYQVPYHGIAGTPGDSKPISQGTFIDGSAVDTSNQHAKSPTPGRSKWYQQPTSPPNGHTLGLPRRAALRRRAILRGGGGVVVVDNNAHQLPIGVVQFEHLEGNRHRSYYGLSSRAHAMATLPQQLGGSVTVTNQFAAGLTVAQQAAAAARESEVKAQIMQDLIANKVDVASEKYTKHKAALSETARKEIAWYVRQRVDEDVIPFYFADLLAPIRVAGQQVVPALGASISVKPAVIPIQDENTRAPALSDLDVLKFGAF
ncbi:expressed unknown protein [Seminavis robusta]|uniref:PARP catalytic domain-containing protein n=1 Tax=Seminavis robusta TaxID=568900 RepID=A0A9N8ERM1_9STRA|nr:expressed unknown protein [Seminavis robusta]|eukprot:Sro1638_g287790.1 n/a (883) ;mRNA; f:17394-20042